MPYYCTVPRCTSMAGKAKNVSFHQFPRDEELARLWNDILKRGKPYTKYSKVCSLHFKPEDYTITSVGKNKGQWRTLRKDAVPSQNLPSETPAPYSRKQWESWSNSTPNVIDQSIHHQVAQAIYMQTMLAMQAAGSTEPPSHQNAPTAAQEVPQTSSQECKDTDITSYKCSECTRCFKDPDVFLLHKRTHTKEKSNGVEKENYNMTLTLRSNPILANLLKTNNEVTFDPNVATMENLLMTALAANMDYLRNFSVLKEDKDSTPELNDNSNISRRDRSNSDLDPTRGDRGINPSEVKSRDGSNYPQGLNLRSDLYQRDFNGDHKLKSDLGKDHSNEDNQINHSPDENVGLSYAMNFSTKIENHDKSYGSNYYKERYFPECDRDGKNDSDGRNDSENDNYDNDLNESIDSNLVIDESV